MNRFEDVGGDQVVELVKSYMLMMDQRTAPSVDDFLSQHVELADQLREPLEGLALVHRVAGPSASEAGPFPVQESSTEFTSKPIGDFQIVGELGRGGMGVVYEAQQLSLGRRVALKVLPFASGLDEVRLQRFRNEAHAAAALHHTHIVPVYAVGSDRGVHYYAMQLIDGKTLSDFIASLRDAADAMEIRASDGARNKLEGEVVPLPEVSSDGDTKIHRTSVKTTLRGDSRANHEQHFRSVVKLIHQATLAIDHAHQYGVVHRDIKPANLLLDSAGKIWVTDFGLAQVQSDQSSLTRTGDPMGTLRYMSPEQAGGRRDEIDHRTDVYSLGVTLYELLTLRPAIAQGNYRDMLNHVATSDPPSPQSIEPNLPIEIDTIVRKAIAKSPVDRYATAADFADDLQAWLDDKPIKARPPTMVERVNKWRRRNSGLVAVASLLLLVTTAALATTTVTIWTQQRETSEALGRETQQRRVAEKRFVQARKAVETFSQLSESELSHRDGLQDLRRSFLETSLAFYQEFLDDPVVDATLESGLKKTKDRVQGMVAELRILDDLEVMMLLQDDRVLYEIGLSEEATEALQGELSKFMDQRSSLANRFVGGLEDDNDEMSALINEFDAATNTRLSATQFERLRQLNRQKHLPFTFKRSEIISALSLSGKQVEQIDQIIEQSAPKPFRSPRGGGPRGDGPRGDGPGSRGRNGPPHDGPPRGPGHKDHEMGNLGRGPGPQDSAMNAVHREATKVAVERILTFLRPDQQEKWLELVGDDFQW